MEPDKTIELVAEMDFEAPEGAVAYQCPMHPEVVSDAADKCPQCGMKLMPTQAVLVYVCPMHPDVVAEQPGKCPQCAMKLMPAAAAIAYVCPMHPDVVVERAINGDPTNNSGFSNFGCTTPQNETTIAANPTNPNNLVAGANDYRVCRDFTGLNDGTGWAYYSFDGGQTWGNVQLPALTAETGATGTMKKFDSAGDPALAFSPDGVAYYANIVFSRVSFASGIVVSSSRDGGRTWSAPSLFANVNAGNFFNDKEWIAAGPNGRVTVTWTRFSQDQGCGLPRVADRERKLQGLREDLEQPGLTGVGQRPSVRPGLAGAIRPRWCAVRVLRGDITEVGIHDRRDGRCPLDRQRPNLPDEGARPRLRRFRCYPFFAGRQTLTAEHFRLNSYPSMSVDPVSGKIAIVWTDQQGSGNCGTGGTSFTGHTSNQVKLIRGTWAGIDSAPVEQVTPVGSPDKVFPSVASHNDQLAISYYTREYALPNTTDNNCMWQTNTDPTMIPPSPSTVRLHRLRGEASSDQVSLRRSG